jgi:hypothetical protein
METREHRQPASSRKSRSRQMTYAGYRCSFAQFELEQSGLRSIPLSVFSNCSTVAIGACLPQADGHRLRPPRPSLLRASVFSVVRFVSSPIFRLVFPIPLWIMGAPN